MRRASVCALLACVMSSPAWADQPRRLTEREFIREYQKVEPRLRGSAAQIGVRQAAVAGARTLLNPQLSFARESVGGEAENFAGVGLFFSLGGRSASIQSARALVRASRHTLTNQQRRLTSDALVRFYAAVYARQRTELLISARKPLFALVQRLRAQAKAGERAGYDRDRLELELVRFDATLSAARTRHNVARVDLSRLLGDTSRTVHAKGSLAVKRPAPLATLLTGAVEQRSDWRAARSRLDAARAAGAAAKRWWVPAFNLTAGVRTRSTSMASDVGYQIALNVQLPIFNRRQAARRRAAAQRQRALADMSWAAVRVRGQVRVGHARLLAALDQIAKLEREQLARAERLVKRATVLYRAGERRVVELVDAYRVALDIRLRKLELQYRAKLAELALRRALGTSGGHR